MMCQIIRSGYSSQQGELGKLSANAARLKSLTFPSLNANHDDKKKNYLTFVYQVELNCYLHWNFNDKADFLSPEAFC